MKLYIISLIIALSVVSLVFSGFLGAVFFSKDKIVEKNICTPTIKTVYVDKIITVEKPVYKYINQCSNRESTAKPNVAYIKEDGVFKIAGSDYKNKQSECARLHNRSLC